MTLLFSTVFKKMQLRFGCWKDDLLQGIKFLKTILSLIPGLQEQQTFPFGFSSLINKSTHASLLKPKSMYLFLSKKHWLNLWKCIYYINKYWDKVSCWSRRAIVNHIEDSPVWLNVPRQRVMFRALIIFQSEFLSSLCSKPVAALLTVALVSPFLESFHHQKTWEIKSNYTKS